VLVADQIDGTALETHMAKQRMKSRVRTQSRAKRDQGALIGVLIVVALAAVILIYVLVNQINNSPTKLTTGAYGGIPQSMTAAGAPILGNPDAKITIMEFADFSCPHCLEYHPIIKDIIEQYVRPGKARLIFQPETFVGQQFSQTAAEAALCAAKQNSFWEMQDALFQIQETRGYQAFTLDTVKATSDSLGLNTGQLLGCMERRETATAIQASAEYGNKLGVTGTPAVLYSTDGTNFTFFTSNGQQVIPPFQLIAQTIEQNS
jgi:protein-disulfide isomerase